MNASKLLHYSEMAVTALQALDDIVSLPGGATTDAVLAAVKAILGMLDDGFSGKATPDEVLARIDALHASLKGNDDAADATLRDKFDVP